MQAESLINEIEAKSFMRIILVDQEFGSISDRDCINITLNQKIPSKCNEWM